MFLKKPLTVHYVDSKGTRVSKDTPGARKRRVKGKKWVVCYRDEYGRQRSKSLYGDKVAAVGAMNAQQTKLDRLRAGVISPTLDHLKTDAEKVLEEFLATQFKRTANKHPKYADETKRILRKMLKECDVSKLGELNAGVVRKYLDNLDAAPNTKKKHHSAMCIFAKWLTERERIENNFMLNVSIPQGDVETTFRALSKEEFGKLLESARQRPLNEALTIRKGKNKGKLLAKVAPSVKQRLDSEGWERSLLYKVAATTGLRKEELARLKVGFIDFDFKPYPVIEYGAIATKAKKKAKLWLIPDVANELKCWIIATGKQENDFVFSVPEKLNRIFQRDLEEAGIVSMDTHGNPAKFRSLRVTSNVLLGDAGLSLKMRQLFMRHADIRLTANQYDDTTLMDIEEIVPTFQSLNLPPIRPA